MTTKDNLDFPLSHSKRFIKETLGEDVLISGDFPKNFGKSLRVFIHYLLTISDDITKERKKGIISVNDVEAAIKEIGLENLFAKAGKAPKIETIKRPRKAKETATLEQTMETLPSQMEEMNLGDKIQEEVNPTQTIPTQSTELFSKGGDVDEPEGMEIQIPK